MPAEDNGTALPENEPVNAADDAPEEEEHILKMWEPFDFSVGKGYDYLHFGVGGTFLYWFMRSICGLVLQVFDRVFLGMRIRGRNNIHALDGAGAVVVCNHVHPMDCTVIDCAFPLHRMYYTMLESNYRIPVARCLIYALGGVPIPSSHHAMGEFYSAMSRALANGAMVCMYPEAVLHPYYRGLRRFRGGAFTLAAGSGAPVLPCVITYREPRGIMKLLRRRPFLSLDILPAVLPGSSLSPHAAAQKLRGDTFAAMDAAIRKAEAQKNAPDAH